MKKPEETIRIVVCRVGAAPCVETIPNTLEGLQAVIGGGYIQEVNVLLGGLYRAALLCDEDGLSKELPPNRSVAGHNIVGTCFLAKSGGAEYVSLSDDEAKALIAAIES